MLKTPELADLNFDPHFERPSAIPWQLSFMASSPQSFAGLHHF
jgi:hypothetical protein